MVLFQTSLFCLRLVYVKESKKDQECNSAFIILICSSKRTLLKVPNFHEVPSSCEKSHSWKVEMFKTLECLFSHAM